MRAHFLDVNEGAKVHILQAGAPSEEALGNGFDCRERSQVDAGETDACEQEVTVHFLDVDEGAEIDLRAQPLRVVAGGGVLSPQRLAEGGLATAPAAAH